MNIYFICFMSNRVYDQLIKYDIPNRPDLCKYLEIFSLNLLNAHR